MSNEDKIQRLNDFKHLLQLWRNTRDPRVRTQINQERQWVGREIMEAGCYATVTISPPPAVGGLLMRNVDPFNLIFDPPYGTRDVVGIIGDMIDRTIGVLKTPPSPAKAVASVQIEDDFEKGYAFVAMKIDENDRQLDDVLDAIKEACTRCGIHAERVDEAQTNERITDRILESIRRAEYVIVDLSDSRPNVFYEAGYAQGLNKTPIYIARHGTKLEFDLKDYPIIFFQSFKQLKDNLEARLRGLAHKRASPSRAS